MTVQSPPRDWFPVTASHAFLNHAAICPPPGAVARAVREFMDEVSRKGMTRYDQWMARVEEVRELAASLVGASAREIAFVGNTSEGLGIVAGGLSWAPGDSVVVPRFDFPANIYPWLNLERLGVKVRFIGSSHRRFDVSHVERALGRRTRLVAVSSVDFATGWRCDLEALGAFCREKGVLLCVDGIQSVGAMPVDVKALGVHFLAAGGHKWLLGPMGTGFLYVAEEIRDQVHPPRAGWKSVKGDRDFFTVRFDLKEDAARYEPGTMNIAGLHGLGVAMGLLLGEGLEEVHHKIRSLVQDLREGLSARGQRVVTPVQGERGSGIISFSPTVEPEDLHKALTDSGVMVALRNGLIRLSPHFYNTREDCDRFFQVLDRFC